MLTLEKQDEDRVVSVTFARVTLGDTVYSSGSEDSNASFQARLFLIWDQTLHLPAAGLAANSH